MKTVVLFHINERGAMPVSNSFPSAVHSKEQESEAAAGDVDCEEEGEAVREQERRRGCGVIRCQRSQGEERAGASFQALRSDVPTNRCKGWPKKPKRRPSGEEQGLDVGEGTGGFEGLAGGGGGVGEQQEDVDGEAGRQSADDANSKDRIINNWQLAVA